MNQILCVKFIEFLTSLCLWGSDFGFGLFAVREEVLLLFQFGVAILQFFSSSV